MSSEELESSLFGRLISRMVSTQLVICELVVVVLAIFVSLDAILRWAVNWSFLVVDELGGYGLVILSFLGMSIALHDGALFRVEALYERLSVNGRARLQLVFDVASLGLSLLLLWQCYGLAARSLERGVIAPTTLLTPLWIPQSVMAIGALCLSMVLGYHIWGGIQKVRKQPQEYGTR